jgi:predicted ATP-grasp superfamily ATP-dependent carboligase
VIGVSSRRKNHRGDGRVGAVVVGGDYQGLGIVRSLGRHDVPVGVIDDERSIARFSRYASWQVRVPSLREPGETIGALLDIGRRLGLDGWVLYPTREETVAAFAQHKQELERIFRVPTPDWNTTRWAWDKRLTYSLAERLGIPHPRTWQPRSIDELRMIDASPPFVIKPAIKEHFIYATKAKAWRADTNQQLEQLYARASQVVGFGEVMVQELIPGDGRRQFAYCAFFKEEAAVGKMVVRRNRQHPLDFGRASTFVETIDLPVIEDLSERFLRAIGYYGLVELEYKYDDHAQTYKLLDVNARTWGYHSIGHRAGVDFPYLLYSDVMGWPVETCRGRAGVSWIRLVTDLPTGLAEIGNGRIDVRSYLASLRRSDVESVFSRKDPLPGVMELALIPYLSVKRGF